MASVQKTWHKWNDFWNTRQKSCFFLNIGLGTLEYEGQKTLVACKTMNRKTETIRPINDDNISEEEEKFRRNQQHMAFIERDVLFLGKDCKFTAALVFADFDDDHFYLVQAAVCQFETKWI